MRKYLFAAALLLILFSVSVVNASPMQQDTPVITIGVLTGSISACRGTASAVPDIQTFSLSGDSLSGNITVKAPAGFQVSLKAASAYADSVVIKPNNSGIVNFLIIYVRSSSKAPTGYITGNVTISTPLLVNYAVPVNATISPIYTVNAVASQTVANGASTTVVNFSGTANTFTWTNNKPGIGLNATGSGDIPAFTAINTNVVPIIATIKVTPYKAGSLYVSNGSASTTNVINSVTGLPATNFATGLGGAGVAVSPDGSRVYMVNSASNNVSVVNTATNSVMATVPVKCFQGGVPAGIVISPDGQTIYVTNNNPGPLNNGTILAINTVSYAVTATINNVNCNQLAISPDGSALYAADANDVAVISTATNTVVNYIPVNNVVGVSVSADGSTIYVAAGTVAASSVYVIIVASSSFLAMLPLPGPPSMITISPDGNNVYTSLPGLNEVASIGTSDYSVNFIPVGKAPNGLCISTDNNNLYVINTSSKNISVVNRITNTITATLPLGFSSASSGNFILGGSHCPGTPVTFTITVESPPSATPGPTSNAGNNVLIPTAFTPNGDGINDTWNLQNITDYPAATVQVFNRYGKSVFYSKGYPIPWNGKYNSTNLPNDTYYYIINLNNGQKPMSGYVAVIR